MRAGSAYVTDRHGAVSVVFDYDAGYLSDRRGYPLSPDLSLATGRYSRAGLPGCFAEAPRTDGAANSVAKRIRAQAGGEGHQPGPIRRSATSWASAT